MSCSFCSTVVARVVNLTLFLPFSANGFLQTVKKHKCIYCWKKYFCNQTPQECRHCITAFGAVLCYQCHKRFSVLEDKKPQETPKICMSDDAGKIIFIWSFIKVNYLAEGCDVPFKNPRIASLVLPQKPFKPAMVQKGKYCTLCFTHRKWKQSNSEQFIHW